MLMILVKDLSAEKELQKEMEQERVKSKSEMEMFYSILHLEPELFSEFITSAENDLDSINDALESETGNHNQRIDKIFQYAHSIKGNAALLELDFIADRAHEFEDKIELIRNKNEIFSEDFLSLTIILSELYGVINQVQQLMNKLINFRHSLVESSLKEGELLALSLKKLAEKTARERGKNIKFKFEAFKSRDIPSSYRKPLKDLMIQLVRNAVTHGIESEEIRKSRGKDAAGTIAISSHLKDSTLSLTVRDNGGGIDFNKLLYKYQKNNTRSTPDKKELFQTIFQSGTSTSKQADIHSGRGMGMALVKNIVDDLKGKIVIKTQDAGFCEFQVSIPLGNS